MENEEKQARAYYAIIPASVRYDKNIPAAAKLLYGEITALCNDRGYCWAKNGYFAELYGVSRVTVSRWVSALVKGGYIRCQVNYKPGTKEIDYRAITIAEAGWYYQKCKEGINKNVNTPINKNVKDNNTLVNNTNEKEEHVKEPESCAAIIADYNATCSKLPKVQTVSEARRRAIRARLRDMTPARLHEAFEMANGSKFLTGETAQGSGHAFRANFDWIMKEANIAKILDGNYTDRQPAGQARPAEFYGAGDTLPF